MFHLADWIMLPTDNQTTTRTGGTVVPVSTQTTIPAGGTVVPVSTNGSLKNRNIPFPQLQKSIWRFGGHQRCKLILFEENGNTGNKKQGPVDYPLVNSNRGLFKEANKKENITVHKSDYQDVWASSSFNIASIFSIHSTGNLPLSRLRIILSPL